MIKQYSCLLFLLAILFIPSLSLPAKTRSTLQRDEWAGNPLIKAAFKATVFIYTVDAEGSGSGNGFIIDKKGLVVTNFHVVADAKSIIVRLHNGWFYPVSEIVFYDAAKDICILRIRGGVFPSLSLGDSDSLVLKHNYFRLRALYDGRYKVFENKYVETVRFLGKKYKKFLGKALPGNSGAPLLDHEGRVVGIISRRFHAAKGVERQCFLVIPLNEVKGLFRKRSLVSLADFSEQVGQEYALTLKGLQYFRRNDFEKAIVPLKEAVVENPGHSYAYYLLAKSYRALKQYSKAIDCGHRIIAIHPDCVSTYLILGNTYDDMGSFWQAMTYYKKAEELDPDNPDVYREIGTAYANQGDLKKAKRNWLKARELFKAQDNPDGLKKMNEYLDSLRY